MNFTNPKNKFLYVFFVNLYLKLMQQIIVLFHQKNKKRIQKLTYTIVFIFFILKIIFRQKIIGKKMCT